MLLAKWRQFGNLPPIKLIKDNITPDSWLVFLATDPPKMNQDIP